MKFSQEEKTRLLEDWRQSGKNKWAYAKEKGICPQTFARWVKPGKKRKPCFVEVTKKVLAPLHEIKEIIIEKGDILIRLPLSVEIKELQTVITVIGSQQ